MPSQDLALDKSGGVPARMLNAVCPVRCSALARARLPHARLEASWHGERSENEGRRMIRQNRECLCWETFPNGLQEALCFAEWIGGSTARTRSHSAPVPCHSRSVRRDARVSLVQEEGGVRGVRSARGSPLSLHSHPFIPLRMQRSIAADRRFGDGWMHVNVGARTRRAHVHAGAKKRGLAKAAHHVVGFKRTPW